MENECERCERLERVVQGLLSRTMAVFRMLQQKNGELEMELSCKLAEIGALISRFEDITGKTYCPMCWEPGTMTWDGRTAKCTACGFSETFDPDEFKDPYAHDPYEEYQEDWDGEKD